MKFSLLIGLIMSASTASLVKAAGCSDLKWSDDVLNRFPSIEKSCRDIIGRDRKGFATDSTKLVGVYSADNVLLTAKQGGDENQRQRFIVRTQQVGKEITK